MNEKKNGMTYTFLEWHGTIWNELELFEINQNEWKGMF